MVCKDSHELLGMLKAVKVVDGNVTVSNKELINKDADLLVENIVLSSDQEIRNLCFWLIWNIAGESGVFASSIQPFYEARGKGKFSGFTVPAINLRAFTYPTARSIFRVANKHNAGAFIFEIAKSEIGYTSQRPNEFASLVLAAAVREGYRGPVFIQGDHFQIKTSSYLKNPEEEVNKLKDLIDEAIKAGFYNIDIDSSTLVDLEKTGLLEQQRLNFEVCGIFTRFIREKQPEGIDVSIGGEIGEVGGKNSTPDEIEAFMNGYLKYIGSLKGISKMSVQTGTSHGGVVLPDGSLAQVKIDFEVLKILSEVARKKFSMAGAVQHGASTLPSEAFHKFPEIDTAEIHLATQFQNIIYDSLPLFMKEKIYSWIRQNLAEEKTQKDTDEQFLYKTRKKALGPFKKELSSLTKDTVQNIALKLEEEFDFLFQQLKIENTKDIVGEYVKPVAVEKRREDFGVLKELGELEGAD